MSKPPPACRHFAPNPPSQATADVSEDPLRLGPSRLRWVNGFVLQMCATNRFAYGEYGARQVVRAALDPYTPSTLKSPEASYSSVSWGTAAKVQPDENGAVSEINAEIGGEDGWTLKMIGDLYNCDGSLVICFACLFKHLAVESLRGGLPFGSTQAEELVRVAADFHDRAGFRASPKVYAKWIKEHAQWVKEGSKGAVVYAWEKYAPRN